MPEQARHASEPRHKEAWVTKPERGSVGMLRFMSAVSLRCGRGASRVLLYIIVCYFYLLAPGAGRDSNRYLRRVLARRPSARDRFAHLLSFATAIHDRVYLLNDQFHRFEIEVHGAALLERAQDTGAGCFLMGAHLGSFEVARAFGRQHPGVQVVMAMYADNARKISAALTAINPHTAPDIIRLGSIDAMLQVRARLDAGAFVGVLADRTLGDEPVQRVGFLGAEAPFPTGPWRAAARRRRPVLFIAGLYCGGNRYRVVIDEIADFTLTAAGGREAAVRAAIERYAALLEAHCQHHPYNWFNFYDFWHEQPPASSH
jgi:predicted LPLAT superfamily acyltransferase